MFNFEPPPEGPRSLLDSVASPRWLWKLLHKLSLNLPPLLMAPLGVVVGLAWAFFLLLVVVFAIHGVLDGFSELIFGVNIGDLIGPPDE